MADWFERWGLLYSTPIILMDLVAMGAYQIGDKLDRFGEGPLGTGLALLSIALRVVAIVCVIGVAWSAAFPRMGDVALLSARVARRQRVEKVSRG